MPTVSAILGPWTDETGPNMTPNTPIVGGDGSVDDRSDATYVALRAQQINDFIGAQQSAFEWYPAPIDLPPYDEVINQSITYRVRHQLVMMDPAYAGFQLFQFWSVSPDDPWQGNPAYAELDVTHETFAGQITTSRWQAFRDGTVELGAFIPVTEFMNPADPGSAMPPGTEARIHLYEYEVIFNWDLPSDVAAGRLWPRTDGRGLLGQRIWPPDPSRDNGRITGYV